MDRKTSLFLDLAAIEFVGKTLLDPRPAVVVADDGGRFLWANAAGAALFGEDRIGGLLDRTISDRNPVKAQIVRLAHVLSSDRPRTEILRIGIGGRLETVAASCRRLDVSDGVRAVFAVAARQPARAAVPLQARAQGLCAALVEDRLTIEISDREGSRLAGADINAPAPAIMALIMDMRDSGARLLRRSLAGAHGPREATVVAFTADGQPHYLALTAPTASRPAGTDAAKPDARAAEPRVLSSGERAQASGANPVVRFVWASDATGGVTFASPELATVVGAENAAIIGMDWPTITRAFGLTPAADIEEAIKRGTAWAKTVHWPVAHSDECVAVDLAAMPDYSRAGELIGFRGFGTCRPSDRRRDQVGRPPPAPDPTQAKTAPTFSDASTPARPPHRSQPPPITPPPEPSSDRNPAEVPVPQAHEASNVVRLPGTMPQVAGTPRLSGVEQDAFRRIAEALRVGKRMVQGDATGDVASIDAVPPPAHHAGTGDLGVRQLLDCLPTGLLVARDGKTVHANRAILDCLGYASADAFIAAGGMDAMFKDGPADFASVNSAHREFAVRRADGGTVHVSIQLNTIDWEATPALLLSVTPAGTVSADGPPAAEIAATQGRIRDLEAMLDTATDGIIVVDSHGRIESMNRGAEALFAGDEGDYRGRNLTDLLADESHRPMLDYLDGLASNGVASVLNDGREVIGKVPQGGLIPLFMTLGRIGEDRFCAVLRDITHWKTVEDELINARRAAEIASTQKSEFLAKISHEIRTPLNAIIGFSEIMIDERFGPIGNDRYRAYVNDIHVSGTLLISLINDLLDLSKVEAGKLELSFEAVAVNAIIQECVALMQPLANRDRIIIRTALSGEVPNVVADSRSLRQILLNLTSNAIKFTKAGGQVIVSSALEGSGEVVLRIRDTGVGMSPKEVETALKPFRQIAVREGRDKGTGLGLPLTKALVEANRATMAIDSAPNQGTLVKITFPIERVLAG